MSETDCVGVWEREREKEWSYFCFQHVTQSFAVDENTLGSRLDLVVVVVNAKLVKNLALRDQSVVKCGFPFLSYRTNFIHWKRTF